MIYVGLYKIDSGTYYFVYSTQGSWKYTSRIISVQFSHSVMSESLQLHGLQNAQPPCPSPTPGVYSNSCPLSWWCHPTISSSIVPFFSRFQYFPASGSFLMSQFLASGGQSIGVSASASSFQWIFRTDFLQDWQIWSPFSPRGSQESSPNWTQRKKVEERHTHL